ncbi:MAG: hypothetical protein Tsb0034_23370 [Ekhidna sp.]
MKYSITLIFSFIAATFAIGQDSYEELIKQAELHETRNPDSVLFYALKANELDEDRIEASYWLGVGYRLKNKYDSSQIWYTKYLSEAKTELQIGNAQMGMGGIYYVQGEYLSALEHFKEAAEVFERMGNKSRLAASYTNIGIVMGLIRDVVKSKAYYRQSIELFEELNQIEKSLPALVNLASQYEHDEQYDSAILFAQRCFDIGEERNLTYAIARALFVLAPAYVKSGSPERGFQLAVEGEQLFESMGVTSSAASMKFYKAEALFTLGRLDEALVITQEIEANGYQFEEQLFELISKIYEQKMQFKESLAYQKKFHEAYEAYEKELKSEQVSRLEAQYQSERKENEILRLENAVALQEVASSRKNLIIVSISLITMSGLISLWFFYQKRLSMANEQSAIHKQQLLRSQINPHFIFNSLSSIRGFLFDGNDTQPAIAYLGKFAKLMRMVLELSSKEWVSLEEEVSALQLYLEIQQIRFNKSFDFDLAIDSSLNASEIMVPPLTAQPFIENAIEHGLKGMDKDGKVEIACLKQQGKLVFKIQDNGIGIDHVEPRKNHQSRAIQIFKERLSIIGKRMKMTFSFNISDIGNDGDGRGTLVIYELPLVKV